MELGQDVCRGSARGVAGFDLVEALGTCRDLLTRYGGHPRAAGFTLKRESFAEFAATIVAFANATLSARDLDPVVEIDSELKMRHLKWDVHRLVQELGPFGVGNPTPTFLVKSLRPIDPRCTPKDHLSLKFRGSDGETLDAFGFGLGYHTDWLANEPVDVVFELSSSQFRGYESLELRVRDLKPSGQQVLWQ